MLVSLCYCENMSLLHTLEVAGKHALNLHPEEEIYNKLQHADKSLIWQRLLYVHHILLYQGGQCTSPSQAHNSKYLALRKKITSNKV